MSQSSQQSDKEMNGLSQSTNQEVDVEEDNALSESNSILGQNNDSNRQTKSESLLRICMTEEEKQKISQKYEKSIVKTREAENTNDISKGVQILSEQMDEQKELFRRGGVNENMPLDSKCMQTISGITLSMVKRVETTFDNYLAMEFADKLLEALNPYRVIEANGDESVVGIDQNDWTEFGRKLCRIQKIVPPFHYIHGSFDPNDNQIEPKVRQRRARPQNPPQTTATEATNIDPTSKAKEDTAPEEVNLIFQAIKRLEKKNNTLPYIQVVVNPNSFSETVENIFHSAFLVKDSLTTIDADEDNVPIIRSIDDESHLDLSEQGIQSVLSFTVNDYKNWIKQYGITQPAIKHPNK